MNEGDQEIWLNRQNAAGEIVNSVTSGRYDVAVDEGGAEEDPKVLATALEQHKKDMNKGRNLFDLGDAEEGIADESGWSQVNGSEKASTGKKWSNVANGTATPSSAGKRTPLPKENVRDNKVAYILFYQRIEA